MLRATLDIVLSLEHSQSGLEGAEPAATQETLMEEAFDDQRWLNNNLDMDFWTSLEDYPLFAWPDLAENS